MGALDDGYPSQARLGGTRRPAGALWGSLAPHRRGLELQQEGRRVTPRVGRRHRAVVRVGGGLPVDVSARFPCRSSVARQRTAASRPRPNECRSSVVSNWSVGAGRRCKIRDDDEHQPLLLSRRRGAASHRCTALFVAERALAGAGRTSGPRRGARLGRGSALGLRRAGHISSSTDHVDVGFCHSSVSFCL